MTVIGDERARKARKRHACHWCGEAIEKGEEHIAWVWAEDGRVVTVRCHPECRDAWHYAHSVIDRGYYHDGVGFADHRRGCACCWGTEVCECGLPEYWANKHKEANRETD